MGLYRPRGYVYFIQAENDGLIKIGTTCDHPHVRLANLIKGSPVPLVPLGFVAGGTRVEHAMHVRFARLWSHGEWFRADAELLNFIKEFVRPWPTYRHGDLGVKPDGWHEWLAVQERELERRAVIKWQIRNFGRVLWGIGDMLNRSFPGVSQTD
jgi:hypothetical protein